MIKTLAISRQNSLDRATVVSDLAGWLIARGLEGISREELLEGYCSRLVAAGLPVQRVHLAQRALHPEFGSLGFDWYRDKGVQREQFSHQETPAERWIKSPLYHLMAENLIQLRLSPADAETRRQFPLLQDLYDAGSTDYFAVLTSFSRIPMDAPIDPVNPPEGIAMSWTSDAPDGFSDADISALRELMAPLGLALKAVSDRQTGEDLLKTYLGADAGGRVLSGEIQRGSLQTIDAVVWYFDLQGFTRLSEKHPPEIIISMLNDYFGSVVSIVDNFGGNVLKFMGDGLLAIFSFEDQKHASRSAVDAAHMLHGVFTEVSLRRKSAGLPHTGYALALHSGDVLYGNIGGENRLDFTIIGPAVNTTSRILGMCGPLDQQLIISSRVATAVAGHRDDLVSLGRYMLRGVPEPQELFTLYLPDQTG